LVEPGFNSGWRDVFGMANETLDGLVLFNSLSRYSDPELAWIEPIGPTALTFLDSDNLGEEYENDMFVGDIVNGALYRFDLDENRTNLALTGALSDNVVDVPSENEPAIFGSNFGGITDIKVGTDGYLYVLSFVDGKIYRIAPSEEDEPTVPSQPVPQTPPTRDTDAIIDLLIERFAVALDNDSCFDEQDRRRLGNVISRIIEDMLGEDPVRTDRFERVLDRIIEDCQGDNDNSDDQVDMNRNEVNDDNRDPPNRNNDNDNRGHGNGNDDRRHGSDNEDDDDDEDDG
jgi:hypothetical protein